MQFMPVIQGPHSIKQGDIITMSTSTGCVKLALGLEDLPKSRSGPVQRFCVVCIFQPPIHPHVTR